MRTRWERVGAIFILVSAIGYGYYAIQYPVGTAASPGPAMFPLLLAGLTFGLSALLIASFTDTVRLARQRGSGSSSPGEQDARGSGAWWPRAALVCGAIVVYISLAPLLGHLFAGFVLVLIISCAAGTPRWYISVIVAVLGSAFTYLVFQHWLGVPLPQFRLF